VRWTMDSIIKQTMDFVREQLEHEGSGHDYAHIERVYKGAMNISRIEGGNPVIVALAALLHDISDHKFNQGDSRVGAKIAYDFLLDIKVEQQVANHVKQIIETMSYKGGVVDSSQNTLEGQIVQDADRLDALGAIGIARAFTYGGYKKRMLYDPSIKPKQFKDVNEYLGNQSTTINHFYEKLLLLKDLMNTKTGKLMATQRHEFMIMYLNQFYEEWEGTK
jgi:uncharacterized protein